MASPSPWLPLPLMVYNDVKYKLVPRSCHSSGCHGCAGGDNISLCRELMRTAIDYFKDPYYDPCAEYVYVAVEVLKPNNSKSKQTKEHPMPENKLTPKDQAEIKQRLDKLISVIRTTNGLTGALKSDLPLLIKEFEEQRIALKLHTTEFRKRLDDHEQQLKSHEKCFAADLDRLEAYNARLDALENNCGQHKKRLDKHENQLKTCCDEPDECLESQAHELKLLERAIDANTQCLKDHDQRLNICEDESDELYDRINVLAECPKAINPPATDPAVAKASDILKVKPTKVQQWFNANSDDDYDNLYAKAGRLYKVYTKGGESYEPCIYSQVASGIFRFIALTEGGARGGNRVTDNNCDITKVVALADQYVLVPLGN